MINILKLRKLEKENKQKKIQEEDPEIQKVQTDEIVREEKTVNEIDSEKNQKVKGRKKKGKSPGKALEKKSTAAENESVQIETKKKDQPYNSDVSYSVITEEDNPVELFRQNLLKELLNSESLPEFANAEYYFPEESKGMNAETGQIKEEFKNRDIEDYNDSSGLITQIINETETPEKKVETEIHPETVDNINNAKEKNKKNQDSVVHIVSFSLGREYYGVDIMSIREIIRTVDVTKVPRAPEFIEGVINLRGSVIPVINLRTRIKLPRIEFDKSTRIIVIELKDKVIGFIVDEVKEVLRIPKSVIAPPPVMTIGKNVEYITAVAKLESSLIILIDPERLLSSAELDRMKN